VYSLLGRSRLSFILGSDICTTRSNHLQAATLVWALGDKMLNYCTNFNVNGGIICLTHIWLCFNFHGGAIHISHHESRGLAGNWRGTEPLPPTPA